MHNILNYSRPELIEILEKLNQPTYRANQIYNWIFKKFIFEFNKMSNLPKNLINILTENYTIINIELVDKIEYTDSIKFLYKTFDNLYFESVILFDNINDNHITLCLSSQIGCPIKCSFCATGLIGFKRNLEVSEIIGQILQAEKYLQNKFKQNKRLISNIVFMGMGEPFLNYENVIKSIQLINNPDGYNLGSRHITISTVGITDGIKRLSQEKSQIRLAISLHSPFQNIREKLIPIAKNINIKELINTIKEYQTNKDRRVTFEYVLLKNINTDENSAKELSNILKGIDYNINLIIFNSFENSLYEEPTLNEINNFKNYLKKYNIPYVIRESKGSKINAGCGQLGLFWNNLTL